ncbi:50S ribosomal protein L18 [Blattabacterium cuenoti]|uniref:50S ribosomal protein L18 n=1 Tax=Blattabacterium cuenoti TaxID=1653831 RepID=UPI00163CA8AF|nr:50S ribosomal protein L18 [Blattabacterium cuenoti]
MKKKFRKKILGKKNRLRISVFRSNKQIYAQIIDDISSKTLISSSSLEKEVKKNNKVKQSYEVGKLLGFKAKKLNLDKLVFDKGKYLYHGRVKSLVDGIRHTGIKI